MIFQLFLLMGQQATSADQVLDRFAAAQKIRPQLESTMTAQANGGPLVKAKLLLDGNKRALFQASAPGITYTAAIGVERTLELDSSERLYDEAPTIGLTMVESRLSGMATFFPEWIRISDLRTHVQGVKWELQGHEVINGFGCDRLKARTGTAQAGFEASVAVDQIGNIISFYSKSWEPSKRVEKNWTVTTLKMRRGFNPGEFDVPIPVGYMPYSVDARAFGVGVSQQFPLTGWTAPSGSLVSLKDKTGGKAVLVVILGEDCDASARALPWLQKLKTKVPLVFISDGAKPRLVPDALTDPQGTLLTKVGYPGTPFFGWLDGEGKVVALWMGFDPGKVSQLEKDILNKASGAE